MKVKGRRQKSTMYMYSAPHVPAHIQKGEFLPVLCFCHIRNSYITGPSFVADLLHRKSARAIAQELLRAINRLQNEGT